MSKINTLVRGIADAVDILSGDAVQISYLTAVNGTPGAGQFRSTIVNRAPMIDITSDLMPRMGIERIPTKQIMLLNNESVPSNNYPGVYGLVNDKFGRVRFVGLWGPGTGAINTDGQYVQSSDATAYFEVTFVGTGLNAMVYTDGSNRSMAVSIDGGGETTVTNSSLSSVLQGRGYSPNCIFNLAAGLTYGLHTIKVRQTNSTVTLFGLEILNESTNIKTSPGSASGGGSKKILASLSSQAYNTGFDSGTLGARGGRVLVYLKSDGSIGKSVTPTNASSATLTSTDHSNEEVIRTYFWREFGASRSANDDVSTYIPSSASTRFFTLDDGSTSLLNSNGGSVVTSGAEAMRMGSGGSDFVTFTFVGTGLDILRHDNSGGGDVYQVAIDGGTAATISSAGIQGPVLTRVVSGLPFGAHSVKFTRVGAAAAYHLGFLNFVVYGPKKPTLPVGAIELADTFIHADYVWNNAGAISGNPEKNSTGILPKEPAREMVYSGSWSLVPSTAFSRSGAAAQSSTVGNYVEYTFVGTGIEAMFTWSSAVTLTVSIDGAPPASAANVFGGSYSNPTWTVSDGSNGSKIAFTGLSYGKHTIRLTIATVTGAASFCGFNVIPLISTPQNYGPSIVQNALSIGSCGMNDRRSFGNQLLLPKLAKAYAKPINGEQNTTSITNFVVLPDRLVTMYFEKDTTVAVFAALYGAPDSGAFVMSLEITVDGLLQGDGSDMRSDAASIRENVSIQRIVNVSKGWHTFAGAWKVASGGGTATQRTVEANGLQVIEIG